MELRLLNKKEVEEIYSAYMKKDFPEAELKPLDSILGMMDRGCYEPLGAFFEGEFAGYSFMTKIPDEDFLLLDYLAVCENKRQCGMGQKIISALRDCYKGKVIFIESENPDFQENEKKETAKKRLGFYEKNQVRNTGVLSCIWTVHYINFYLSDTEKSKEYARFAIEKIYQTMIPKKEHRDKYVEIG